MEVIRRQPDTKRGPADWFTGDVWIDEISPGPHVKLLSVHFTPGARTAWHVHPFGQLIHVTYQENGSFVWDRAQELRHQCYINHRDLIHDDQVSPEGIRMVMYKAHRGRIEL